MFQGLFISLVFIGAIFAVFFKGFPYSNSLDFTIIVFVFLPMLLIGTTLGFLGERIFFSRFRKLFLIGMFLDYLVSLIYSFYTTFVNTPKIAWNSDLVVDILANGSKIFLIYGIFTVPLMLLGVFLIELWTNPEI